MMTNGLSASISPDFEALPPLVSVVMPVFRSANTLTRSIKSILAQDLKGFEFIIVNEFDEEDVASREIIAQCQKKDGRIKMIQLEAHAGIAESLNIGIRAAKGKYIARMDADDYSYPNRLRLEWEYMEQHPDCLLCGTAFRFIRPQGEFVMRPPCDSDRIHSELLFHNTFGHPTVFFRREEFAQRNYWYNKSFFGEDFELWTRVDGKMANLPEICLDYYNDSNSATQRYSKEAGEYSCRIVKQTIRRQFAIDVDQYAECLFWPALFRSENKMRTDLLIEGGRLLHEIERQNCRYKKHRPRVLLNSLCAQWNRYLWEGFVLTGDASSRCNLPFLTAGNAESFYDCLRVSCRTGIVDENVVFDILAQRVQNLQNMLHSISPSAKIIVFGAGVNGRLFFTKNPEYLRNVYCFSDNAASLHGTVLFGKDVIRPEEMEQTMYDYIVISSLDHFSEIRESLIYDYHVAPEMILSLGAFRFMH